MKHTIKIWEAVDLKINFQKATKIFLYIFYNLRRTPVLVTYSTFTVEQDLKNCNNSIKIHNCKLVKNFFTEYLTRINLLNGILVWVKWLSVQNIWAAEAVNHASPVSASLKAALTVCADRMNQVTFTLIFHLASLY